MKLFFVLFFMAVIPSGFAQRGVQDSIKIYERQLGRLRKEYFDSLRQQAQYKNTVERINALRLVSDDYWAFTLYTTVYSADFAKFNLQNSTAGFSPLSNTAFGIGYGMSRKKRRRILDVNFTAFGLNKTANNGNEKIKTSLTSLFQFEWGYDCIKSNIFNLYPYAGFGLRSATLQYKAKVTTNASFPNVAGIIQNDRSFSSATNELSYQLGLGMEAVLGAKSSAGGVILFLKCGTNMPFREKAFQIAGVSYDPDFKYGRLTGAIGFKFFGR